MNSEKVSLSFHCSLCSQVFQNAFCLINCGHTFCLKCFKEKIQLSQREGDVVIAKCATCNMSTQCTENAEEELREPVMENLLEILGRDKIIENKEMCGSGPECGRQAEYWCPNCETILCGVCFDHHGKTPFTKKHHHQVRSLDQKIKAKARCSSCNVLTTTFCENCQKILCGDCLVRDHNGHQFSDIEKKAEERKSEFEKFIDEVKGHLEQTHKKRTELQNQIEKLQVLLKEQSKRETMLKITHENLKLVKNELSAEHIQFGALTKLENELRRKVLKQQSLVQQEGSVKKNNKNEKSGRPKLDSIVHKENENTFLAACENGDKGKVVELIKSKINVDVKEEEYPGNTGLISACGAWKGHHEIVSELITNKTDLDMTNNDGDTALICACINGYKEICEVLIANKADHSIKNNFGQNALYWAKKGRGKKENLPVIIKLLESLG